MVKADKQRSNSMTMLSQLTPAVPGQREAASATQRHSHCGVTIARWHSACDVRLVVRGDGAVHHAFGAREVIQRDSRSRRA